MSDAVAGPAKESSPRLEQLMQLTRERYGRLLAGRERLVGAPIGLALLVAVVCVAIWVPDPRTFDLPLTLALAAGFALAARVEFQTGGFYAVPTQLVFVPMVFLLPAAILPLAVGAGYVASRAPRYWGRPVPLERMVGEFGDAWFSLGPAVVIALTHTQVPRLEHWPVYVAALGAQLALDAASSCLSAAVGFGMRPRDVLRELWWAHRVDVLLAPAGFAAAVAGRDEPMAWALALPLVALLHGFARERVALVDHQLELAKAYRGTALLLGDVVEDDDEYTGQHSRGVGLLALEVADELGVDDRMRRDIEFGALLHDVGKVAIPKEIINKPGALTEEEWIVMRTHTIEGQRMLQKVGGVLENVGIIVRASHERWDGKGYPDRLVGEEIPLAARIISCCDAYSAITTDRSYRPARSREVAIEELRACAGTQFDPDVVAAVVRVVQRRADETHEPETTVSEGTLDRLASELARAVPIGMHLREHAVERAACRSLIEALDDGIVLHGRDGRVKACNPAGERIFGMRVDELLAAPTFPAGMALMDELGQPVTPDRCPWQVTLATGRPSSQVVLGIKRPGGDVVWLSVSSRPLRRLGRSRAYAAVSSFVDITERRQQDEALRVLVDRDPLTDLHNRRRFQEDLDRQIQRSRRYRERAVLLAIDLDDFKTINDAYGHRAGDMVLRHVADLLRRRLRTTDLIGRLGGDEFAVLLAHTAVAEGEQVAAALLGALVEESVMIDGASITVRASIGVAEINAETRDAAGAFDSADRAMYRAKRASRLVA